MFYNFTITTVLSTKYQVVWLCLWRNKNKSATSTLFIKREKTMIPETETPPPATVRNGGDNRDFTTTQAPDITSRSNSINRFQGHSERVYGGRGGNHGCKW